MQIQQLIQSISKSIGMLWFLASILFLIVLFISLSAYSKHQFKKMVSNEVKVLLENVSVDNISVITENDIKYLPLIIQKWMHNSGVIGKKRIVSVRLKQIGEMRMKPDGKWLPFKAKQYFDIENSSFVWSTKVNEKRLLNMQGRDKFENGAGEMLIKLASLIPVVNEGNNEKINQGTMIRFLSESCWFPSAAIQDYISWKDIDATSAKATFTVNEQSVSGVFKFSTEGDLLSFESQRYFGGKKEATLENWLVEVIDYKIFEGVKIPNKCKVTWRLKDGDFNWLNLEVTDLEYNIDSI